MSLWEYKVITSGKGGFATPALLEKFLNDLGRDEWEIIHFHTLPENSLAFTGMARRTTQRDWTLEDAAAAAARTEADKLRAEFEAKFKSAAGNTPAAGPEEKPTTIAGEKLASDDGMRRVRDTTRDMDPDADEEDRRDDDWENVNAEDELPTFFDAIRPHMRRNQRGPGMSVGVEHLARKWNLTEDDVKGALVECGFPIPEDEDDKPVYHEYEGDLYWLNVNRRGELWLNTKEKPRPVFRTVPATRLAESAEEVPTTQVSTPSAESKPAAETFVPSAPREPAPRPAEREQPAVAGAPLPSGPALLEKIRPLMRRNRRGAGGSGSTTFLSRGLKCTEADLMSAFSTLGLVVPATQGDKPVNIEINGEIWWLNRDQRGGLWINGREKEPGDTVGGEAGQSTPSTEQFPASGDASAAGDTGANVEPVVAMTDPTEPPPLPVRNTAPAPDPDGILAAMKLLLKETKTGSLAGKLDRLAGELGKSPDDVLATLVGVGLKVPEKAREKPVFVEHLGEIFWLSKNAKDELWLNAKRSKFVDKDEGADAGKKRPPRGRSRKASDAPHADEGPPADV